MSVRSAALAAEVAVLRLVAEDLAADADSPDWFALKQAGEMALRASVASALTRALRVLAVEARRDAAVAHGPGRRHPAYYGIVRRMEVTLARVHPRVLSEVMRARRALVNVHMGDAPAMRLEQLQLSLDQAVRSRQITGITDALGRKWTVASYTEWACGATVKRAEILGIVARA